MPSDARASAQALPAGNAATRGVLLVVLAAGFWSLSGILVRLIEAAGPWQIILFRSLSLTATMLLLMVVSYGRSLGRALARAAWDGLLAGVSFSLASGCFILAVQHTTVANALFMAGIAPFITALLGCWLLAEPVAPATWGGLVLCALGVAVMVGGGVALEGNTGNALALVSAIAFALFSFFLRRGRQSDMLPAILASGVISAGLALLMLLAVERLSTTGSAHGDPPRPRFVPRHGSRSARPRQHLLRPRRAPCAGRPTAARGDAGARPLPPLGLADRGRDALAADPHRRGPGPPRHRSPSRPCPPHLSRNPHPRSWFGRQPAPRETLPMADQPDRSEALARLWALIKDVRVAMLTTWDGHRLRSRPMHGFQDVFQGELYFYTRLESGKTREVVRYDQVNLAYAEPQRQVYVSVSGSAEVVVEPVLLKKYWNSAVAAWFPKGLEDPDLSLIKVSVEEAEYWDMTTSRMRYLFELGRANLTGREPELGEHGSVQLEQGFRRPVE